MEHSSYYCSNCKAEVDKYADSCPHCKHVFINSEAGVEKVAKIRTTVKRKGKSIKWLLAFTVTGLFVGSFFNGAMEEFAGNADLVCLLLGADSLVIVISLIGIFLSSQYLRLVGELGRQATVISPRSSESEPQSSSEPDLQPSSETSNSSASLPSIYEYLDDGTYKWICGFCDGENTTDEARCPICGYLRMQR